jgi:uncharacterized protein YecE (DUF72 family)
VTECIVGCCGWTQAQAEYVKTFDAVELQTTFYQPPGDAAARKWKLQAPPAFRFCMKAWQLITHTPSSPTCRRLKFAIADSEKDLYGSFRPTEQVALAWQRWFTPTHSQARLKEGSFYSGETPFICCAFCVATIDLS